MKSQVSRSTAAGRLTRRRFSHATGVARIALALIAALATLALAATSALAASTAPAWGVDSVAAPTNFSPARNAGCEANAGASEIEDVHFCDVYTATVTNIGAQQTSGATITVKDTLPAGVTVRVTLLHLAEIKELGGLSGREELPSSDCHLAGLVVTCTIAGRRLAPDAALILQTFVTVDEPDPAPATLTNTVAVEGGGAAKVEVAGSNTVDSVLPAFGLSGLSVPLFGEDGAPETQAGAHPYELSAKFDLSSTVRYDPEGLLRATSVQDLRDAVIDLPLGVSGSAVAAPMCTLHQLSAEGEKDLQGQSACPVDTIVGYIQTYPEGDVSASSPVYNIVPERGAAAELGYIDALGASHVIEVSIAPTPQGYVLRSTASEIPQVVLNEITTEIYGDPAARDKSTQPAVPMFTNSEDCSGEPLKTTVYMDSWQDPAKFNANGTPVDLEEPAWVKGETESSSPVTGCAELAGLFNPEIEAKAESDQAESPTGLQVNLKVPQSEGVEALGTPPVKDTVVVLPEGMSVNPSSANGLQACSEAQIGWQGHTPAATGELEDFDAAAPECPEASKIGTVELETPDLPSEACKDQAKALSECATEEPAGGGVFPEREKTPLTGSIYVASEDSNPFGSLLAIYIVVDDPRTGVLVKIPAEVKANETTGQLTTTVDDTPQFPFSELRTHFFGGDTAALKTPATCGSYAVGAEVTPWSAPESGPPASLSSSFDINQAAGGGGCSAPGFAPSFSVGTQSSRAGAFSPLTVTFSRNDGEQDLSGASITLPPGVAGIIAGIPQCGEAQANAGTCGEGSLIGEASAAVGAGSDPYWVHGGKIYLTGPYNGGPFGLSIVVPTTAGPYTLTGNAGYGKEVVRVSLRVNPKTAQVTAVENPLPSIIQGIPLDIRTVVGVIDRPGFAFNPTSCEPMSVTGTLSSTSGTSVPVSDRFQASECAKLAFKPSFSASTQAKTSRKQGASLTVNIAYPASGQANIAKVKVELPKQLPSRLATLNQACTEAQFDADPAGCPAASDVGTATAVSPILNVPLTGPAYFVSHGSAKFPELIVVLQGEGVTIDLAGETFVSKSGVTTSTFATVPDAPVSSFKLTLPEQSNSALAAPGGKLCTDKLKMPTVITAQDGAVIEQDTKIKVSGCAKHKKAKAKKKKRRRGKKGKKRGSAKKGKKKHTRGHHHRKR